MNDAEISRRLALSIGWPQAEVVAGTVAVFDGYWRKFDYRDPAVIWPIAEQFDCFPHYYTSTKTWACSPAQWVANQDAETAAKAVALAVIKHHEGRKT